MMSSAGAIAASLAAARRRRENDRRRRENAEKERQRRVREDQRRKEQEKREDLRRRQEKEQKRKNLRKELYIKQNLQTGQASKHNQENVLSFTDKLEIKYKDLPIVHEGAYESVLADGSRLSSIDSKYVRTYPDGRVQEYYSSNFYGQEHVLKLTKEELPNGAMVIYKHGKKAYQRDEEGNYTYNKMDQYGKLEETLEGKIDTKEVTEFTDELEIKYKDLPIVHEGAYESVLADGSRLSSIDSKYVRTYPDGRVQEYYSSNFYGQEHVLKLTKEELPNGAMVIYKHGKKAYQRDEEGNYTYNKMDQYGKLEETLERTENTWKRTVYDNNGEVKYYITSDEPHKKYYPSGKLYEETTDKGDILRYAENGVCLYEEDAKHKYSIYQLAPNGTDRVIVEQGDFAGWTKRYENGICLAEQNIPGLEIRYVLAPDGENRLISQRLENKRLVENYSYYPSGKLKEIEYPREGISIKYNEDGTYKKYDKTKGLIEEKTSTHKITYTYYNGTTQVEHVRKYDLDGKEIVSEYKHFNEKGKEDTAYYLALENIKLKKQKREEQRQAKKGIPPEERKIKPQTNVGAFFDRVRARIKSLGQ